MCVVCAGCSPGRGECREVLKFITGVSKLPAPPRSVSSQTVAWHRESEIEQDLTTATVYALISRWARPEDKRLV